MNEKIRWQSLFNIKGKNWHRGLICNFRFTSSLEVSGPLGILCYFIFLQLVSQVDWQLSKGMPLLTIDHIR